MWDVETVKPFSLVAYFPVLALLLLWLDMCCIYAIKIGLLSKLANFTASCGMPLYQPLIPLVPSGVPSAGLIDTLESVCLFYKVGGG